MKWRRVKPNPEEPDDGLRRTTMDRGERVVRISAGCTDDEDPPGPTELAREEEAELEEFVVAALALVWPEPVSAPR